MTDSKRIKDNIWSMIQQGAPESDIDDYVASETGPDGQAYRKWLQERTPSTPNSNGLSVMVDGLPKPPPKAPKDPGYIQGMASSALEGIIPNLANNIAGAGAVAGDGIGALLTDSPFEPGKSFKEGYDRQEDIKEGFAEHHPNADFGGKAAGFIGSLALPITKFGQAGNASAKTAALNGAATGGIYGGIGGALNDSGAGRLENAAMGGIGGTALGAAATPVMRGLTSASSWSRQNLPGANAAVSAVEDQIAKLRGIAPPTPAANAQGQRLISREMEHNNISTGMGTGDVPMTPQSMADEVTRRDAMDIPAMPADLGEELRKLTYWALQGRGPMTSRARQKINARQATQGSRIRKHVTDELGDAVDPIQAAQDISVDERVICPSYDN